MTHPSSFLGLNGAVLSEKNARSFAPKYGAQDDNVKDGVDETGKHSDLDHAFP